MIPQRITIEGFLCYRDRQEIDLAGLSLCMLSGPNGSGKSSVFDAITFALFGTHRAGKQGNEDLINKRSDAAKVEFDFTCGGQLWRVCRTVTVRNGSPRPTQQAYRIVDGRDKVEPVPDTTSVLGCNKWVEQCVGLSSDAFATSMLLRQGQADRLLTAQPAERANLLKAVVGLQRYADLHARAVARRRATDFERRSAEAKLAGCGPAVPDADVDAAAASVAQTTDAARAAESAMEVLVPLVEQAQRFTTLSAKLAAALAERQPLDDLLAHADAITADHARLTLLRAALPPLRAVAEGLDRLARSVDAIARLEVDAAAAEADARHVAADVDLSRAAIERLEHESAQTSDRARTVAQRVAELTGQLALADAVAEQRRALAHHSAELAKLPPEPAGDVDRAARAAEFQRSLVAAINWLTPLADHRAGLAAATTQAAAAASAVAALVDPSQAAAVDMATATDHLATATAGQRAAQAAAAQSTADLNHARQRSSDLSRADASADCPTCGKPLTAEQLAVETARRADHLARATAAHADAANRLRAADAAVSQHQRSVTDAQRRRDALAEQHRQAARQAEKAADAVAAHARAADQAIANLPEPLHARALGDPQWPKSADVSTFAADARASAAAAERDLSTARATLADRDRLAAQVDALRKVLANAPPDLPADPAALRQEHAQLTAEHHALQQATAAQSADLKRAKSTIQEQQARAAQLAAASHAAQLKLSQERTRQDGHRDAVVAATGRLPTGWPPTPAPTAAEVSALADEADDLDRRGVPADHDRLAKARANAAQLDGRIAHLRSDLADLPPAAHRPADVVEQELSAARTARAARQSDQQQALANHDDLVRRRAARRQLEMDYQQLAATHHHLSELSDLLDRTGLQLHLMRRAEQQIVGFANGVLDRLSGGGLVLQLRADGDGADRALDLQAVNRHTAGGDGPINVAFLSGSQQFRVAVALALAVGQYAGGGHRLGDCVIIDEGFGSLDAQGQSVMIQELKGLTTIMKRVIVVSHQESFAAAFPHGYRFALAPDGSTRVTQLTE